MEMNDQRAIPPVLERYELKFVIPESLMGPISDFASVYCSPDKYSTASSDGFYRVNNLYFDTADYLFLERKMEKSPDRFNMRIRSYGDDSVLPYFFEIKQKRGDIIKKFRARVDDPYWAEMLEQNIISPMTDDGSSHSQNAINRDHFVRTAHIYNASPKVLTQYRRLAFVSDYDDYGRVTFDRELRYQFANGYSLEVDERSMVPYDKSIIFNEGCSIILEMKCYTSNVPLWMIDLIRTFNLQRRGFSKYATGVSEVLGAYTWNGYRDRMPAAVI